MLSFQEFFAACTGTWKTERIYHFTQQGGSERSYTEFRVTALNLAAKQTLLAVNDPIQSRLTASMEQIATHCPGFAIAFETTSETGEEVSMSLQALFIPAIYVQPQPLEAALPPLPLTAQIPKMGGDEWLQGFYLRDQGYSETGAITGRFTYQPTRQTLEMTTYYRRSVAVDQMRFIDSQTRLRTIVTYERPSEPERPPTLITLVGFGLENRQVSA
ncbi:phycobiliprotein lyase [Trichothermofontia sp.]